jgi:hypothetical protein
MPGQAFALSAKTEDGTIWERFRFLAACRVQEGNLVAGERLWEIVDSSGGAPLFTIQSTTDANDSLECSLDPQTGVLNCRPGPSIKTSALRFELPGGTGGQLRRDGADCTLDQAIALLLDQLVWVEEVS